MSHTTEADHESTATATGVAVVERLPAVVPIDASLVRRRRWGSRWLIVAFVLLAGLGAGYVWLRSPPGFPVGIAFGNGRLEADPIDIDTKLAGRVAELRADEGAIVKAGQVVAVMDTRDLQAQLRQAQELALQAGQALGQARANREQQQSTADFMDKELARATYLAPRGFATVEQLDQRRQQLDGAQAALRGAVAAVSAAEHAVAAAEQQVRFFAVQIADGQLAAPTDGKIEYRVAAAGEVLPAGGKVFTMLDATNVYMDIYLPTRAAGRVATGQEARIVLDAYPEHVLPARVVFVAGQAQFTPKPVETQSERDKLMFRVRARIDPALLAGREALLRTGLPGVTYVRTDQNVAWPPKLTPTVSASRPTPP